MFTYLHGLCNNVRTVVLGLFQFYVTIGLPFIGIIILRIFACGRLYQMIVFFFTCEYIALSPGNINVRVTRLFWPRTKEFPDDKCERSILDTKPILELQ